MIDYLIQLQQSVSKLKTIQDRTDLKFTSNYIARGMGLIAGDEKRKNTFFIYRNSTKLSKEDENIFISIRGPYNTFGRTTLQMFESDIIEHNNNNNKLSNNLYSRNSTFFKTFDFSSLINNNKMSNNDIPIRTQFDNNQNRIKVMFIPEIAGVYEICLISNGAHLIGSPYNVQILQNTSGIEDNFNDIDVIDTPKSNIIKKRVISRVINFVDKEISYEEYENYKKSCMEKVIKEHEMLVERERRDSSILEEFNAKNSPQIRENNIENENEINIEEYEIVNCTEIKEETVERIKDVDTKQFVCDTTLINGTEVKDVLSISSSTTIKKTHDFEATTKDIINVNADTFDVGDINFKELDNEFDKILKENLTFEENSIPKDASAKINNKNIFMNGDCKEENGINVQKLKSKYECIENGFVKSKSSSNSVENLKNVASKDDIKSKIQMNKINFLNSTLSSSSNSSLSYEDNISINDTSDGDNILLNILTEENNITSPICNNHIEQEETLSENQMKDTFGHLETDVSRTLKDKRNNLLKSHMFNTIAKEVTVNEIITVSCRNPDQEKQDEREYVENFERTKNNLNNNHHHHHRRSDDNKMRILSVLECLKQRHNSYNYITTSLPNLSNNVDTTDIVPSDNYRIRSNSLDINEISSIKIAYKERKAYWMKLLEERKTNNDDKKVRKNIPDENKTLPNKIKLKSTFSFSANDVSHMKEKSTGRTEKFIFPSIEERRAIFSSENNIDQRIYSKTKIEHYFKSAKGIFLSNLIFTQNLV